MLPPAHRRDVGPPDTGPHHLAARPARQHEVGIVGLRALQVIHKSSTTRSPPCASTSCRNPFTPAALARKAREVLDAT